MNYLEQETITENSSIDNMLSALGYTYEEYEAAFVEGLEEIRHRISQGVRRK